MRDLLELVAVIKKVLDLTSDYPISTETKITELTGGDSLEAFELLMEIEDHYDITLPDQHTYVTVGDVYDKVTSTKVGAV